MARYRKLPVEIEAVLWDGNKVSEVTPWTYVAINRSPIYGEPGWMARVGNDIHIGVEGGIQIARPGDYIVLDAQGVLSACKPDIFLQTYEVIP